jgi:hypothetical protein
MTLARGSKPSLWWKDLLGLGVVRGVEGDWILEVFAKEVGDGGATRFWLDPWVGSDTLCYFFPRLFKVALHLELNVKDIGE